MAPEVWHAKRTGRPYGAAADWYAFGVTMYELTTQTVPFGAKPEFVNFGLEYRKPTGVSSDLADLLLGLLQWDPHERLGGPARGGVAALKSHPYWRNADWELVEWRRLPSPLLSLVQERLLQPHKRGSSFIRRGREAAVRMAAADAKLRQAQNKRMLADRNSWTEYSHVDRWEFVSADAIAQEYVDSMTSMVSAV